MKTAQASERRSHSRMVVDVAVEERHRGAIYYQRAVNLSLSGVFLDRTLPHPPGTRVELHFPLAEGSMAVDAEVVESPRELGMALRFLGLDRAKRMRLADLLLSLHTAH